MEFRTSCAACDSSGFSFSEGESLIEAFCMMERLAVERRHAGAPAPVCVVPYDLSFTEQAPLLIKPKPDISQAEITDEALYLRRREFIRIAAGAVATAA